MPEPLDRTAFLLRVADAVDLQPAEVGEVLEELSSHLSDAAAGWREAGLDPDDAEQRAIRSLGDPATLGRELGQARHSRKQLLSAVGGGVWSALTFGLWSYLTIWLVAIGVLAASVLVGQAVVRGLGLSYSGWLTGPLESAATVVVIAVWFAWIGWVLPARVATRAGRSVRGVRNAVGVAGLVAASALLWTVPALSLDWVLAVGLPLCPLALLWAARRSADHVTFFPPTRARTRLGLFLGAVVAVTALGFVTANASGMQGGWEVDTSRIGASGSSEPLLDAAPLSLTGSMSAEQGLSTWTVDLSIPDGQLAAYAQRFRTLQLEVWPVAMADGVVTFGAAPLATTAVPVAQDAQVSVDLPAYRTPVDVVTAVVLIAADGRRVVWGIASGPEETPLWHGTIFDWWVNAR